MEVALRHIRGTAPRVELEVYLVVWGPRTFFGGDT